jgi:hypothetical protein
LNASKFVQRYVTKVQNGRTYWFCVAEERHPLIRMGFYGGKNRPQNAALQIMHRFPVRRRCSRPLDIPPLPALIFIEFIESAARPAAEIQLIKLSHDHYRPAYYKRERTRGLQCSEPWTRLDVRNAFLRHPPRETTGLIDASFA